VNYAAGLLLDRFKNSHLLKPFFIISIILNLSLLFAFKYSNFIVGNINLLFELVSLKPVLLNPVHLPIGISFFTFQAISYVIDVYRGETPAQKNPIKMALYIAMFPQLTAGPIIRYHDINEQISNRTISINDFAKGIERFLFGLGKKVLIADTLAISADKIFAIGGGDLTAGIAWLGILLYSIQIYFDFSGYSDMAIGLGRTFGFRFMENFNYPYISQSMQEFWRRWHISLTSWIRDYVFFPIILKRRNWGKWGAIYASMITFTLIGLWHGAKWNFVLWGIFHGLMTVTELIGFNKMLNKLWSPVRIAYVNFVLALSWPLFRAETFSDAFDFISAMFGFAHGKGREFHAGLYLNNEIILAIIFGIIFSAPVYPVVKKHMIIFVADFKALKSGFGYAILNFMKIIVLTCILLASIMSLASGTYNPFIYFRF
jgi:alginate O-acetyltransferase complex protein AlgI